MHREQLTDERVRQFILEAASDPDEWQLKGVLDRVAARILDEGGFAHSRVLEIWNDLIRQGLVGWGHSFSDYGPPAFHITKRGSEAVKTYSCDPSNPDGYMRQLERDAINEVAIQYVEQALRAYNAGGDCDIAAAVMIGGAAESLARELAESMSRVGMRAKGLRDDNILKVLVAIDGELGKHKASMQHGLRARFTRCWGTFSEHIRATRNEAGHPAKVITLDHAAVHAALLIFPPHCRLIVDLTLWLEGKDFQGIQQHA